jgi:hypothetical protein
MIISMVEQLSDRWFREHAGKPGAGSNDKILTSTGKRSTQRKDHMFKLTAEALLGEKERGYTNSTMDVGTDREAESRDLFAFLYDVEVHQVGMCYRDEKLQYLCSPDGLIWQNDDWTAGLELKNPLAKTHVSYLVGKKLPTKYVIQVQSSLFITGLPLWYFCSYVPGLDPFIIAVHPDLELHKKIEAELESFCSELKIMINSMRSAK